MTRKLFGVTGWKNSGKTTLMARLIGELTGRGFAVSVVKHAHASFDIDHEGRDSFRLREAGAREVAVSSPKRFALMRELEEEMSFEEVLSFAGPCDLVLVEGFKREAFPKIEIRREGASSRESLHGKVPDIVAIASDRPETETDRLPSFQLDDIAGMADFIVTHLGLKQT
jgi:molybdopterin-guanine dinucleotide biosynthesis protein B